MKKDNLKHRLKSRFVVISAIALIILQTIIVSVSIYTTYRQMTVKADRMIKQVTISDNKDMRYFKVYYQGTDNSYTFETSRYVLIDKATAINYAQDIIADHSTRGYADDFRYLVHKTDDITIITFLSQNVALDAFHNQAKNLIFISIISILITIFILYLISSVVIKPIILAENKQKEFITSASHELKTPLALMQAQIESFPIDNPGLKPETNVFLKSLAEQIERLNQMSKVLLEIANLNNIPLNERVELNPMVEEIIADLSLLADKKNITLSTTGNSTITGSDTLLYQMIYNLVENAIKYNNQDGSVSININNDDKYTYIQVKDTGNGIPKEYQETIFQPFFRIDKSRNRQFGGVGLGLALVYEIAKLHNGSVYVKDSNNNGTIIEVKMEH